MGRLGKTLISVGSILVVAIIGIVLYIYWPAIKGTVDGNKYYTQEDVQKAYDSGFADGNESETELTAKYEYYKTLVDDYYIQVSTLNEEISKISSENTKYSNQIKELTTQKTNLLTQVENLTTIKNNNDKTITDLNSQITELEKQVNNLTSSGEDKSEQITTLNSQISTLKNTVAQLQSTNEMNVATITSLNTQIANLNNQIADMTLQSQNSTSQITALNNKITELQKSVTYYESYIASLESGEQVVATFEYDGSVYNIQIVNKGSTVSVTTPTSTTYKIFNSWKVGDETIDLSTYTITTNTKIVADITYKYDVKFMVDNTTHNSQIIVKNNCATLPSNPTKDGYEFDGWSIDGVNVVDSISTKQVTDNTTYYAVFTKLHTVTFVYEDATKSTQTIRNGNYATNVTVDNTTYKVFNGWKVNNVIVDLSTYKITTDTQFVADITYKYDVKFMVDYTTHDSQIIVKNNCATVPTAPTKDGYEFDGWSIDGVNVVDSISTKQVTDNTTYYAVFTQKFVLLSSFEIGFELSSTKNTVTSITFDYYTNDNQYLVNGINVIEGISSTSLVEGMGIYAKGTDYYFLSNYDIVLDSLQDLFSTFMSLTSIIFNNFHTSKVTDMSGMFDFCTSLTTLDLSSFNTSNVTNMSNMFYMCESLTTLDLSNFNTSKVTDMSYMFCSCKSLTTLDLSSFNTSNVTNMSYMFGSCTSLTTLNLSSFNTSNVTNMSNMFFYCNSLTILDLSNFYTINVTDMSSMFRFSGNLTTIYVTDKFSVSNVINSDNMFFDCFKLVGTIEYTGSGYDKTYANYTNGFFTYKYIDKYNVKFMVDDRLHTTQVVAKNNCAEVPNVPYKYGYVFAGWTINGVVISDISTRKVTEDVTYYASFYKQSGSISA